MAELQFDLPLGDTEAKKEDLSGFQVGYQETKLRSGAGIADKTYQKILTSYPDYNDNAEAYQQFASLWDNNRVRYTHAMNNRTFALDDNDEITDGEGHFAGASLLYDMDAIKGYLLAEKNGFNQMGFDAVYGSITEEESKRLGKAKEGTSLMGNIVGTLAAYGAEPETIVDFASPGKIIGSTIAKGAAKAFAIESLYAGASEVMRQEKIKEHMERAGLEYSLWDSTQEILINSGFAGAIRGVGSAVLDWTVVNKINKGITNATDKEIFDRFARRENFKLTQNTTKHLHLMDQVEADVEVGKNTDVSLHTDIDINTKADEAIEPTNFREELSNDYQVKGYDADEKILDDNIKAPEITDDVYGGMVNKDDGDALIKEFATHPDIEAELKEIEALEARLTTVQEHPRLEEALKGGRERLAKDIQSPKRLIQKGTIIQDTDKFGGEDKTFRVPASYEKNYAADFTLTTSDVKNIDKGNVTPELLAKVERDLEVLDTNPDYQLLKESIGDGLTMIDGVIYKADGTELLAKGLDNLIAGGVAGIEVDENGNITLDPEKFVLGMVGYTVAKRLATMKIFREALSELPEATNRVVKKATGVDILSSIVSDPTALKNLRAVEQKIKKDPVETLVITDKKGNVLEWLGGSANRVDVSKSVNEAIKNYEAGKILTHNHPAASSLSFNDLVFGIDKGIDEIRAIGHTEKGGDFLYELSGLSKYNKDNINYKEIHNSWEDIHNSRMGYYEPKALANNRVRLLEINQAHTHKTMIDLADKLGLEYKRTRIKEPKIVPGVPGRATPTQIKEVVNKKLFATHRTSINNVARMLDIGVLPAPSFALSKTAKVTEQFGDIVMIPKEKHIDPKKGTSVFGGDAWTPRIKFDVDEGLEVLDLKAPVFDRYPAFKRLAKDAYDGDDFYNMIVNEERYVNMLEHWGKARGNDAYEMAKIAQNQIFKIEKPTVENKIKAIKKLIRDNGGDMRGLEDAITPAYVLRYRQYFNLEDVAKRGQELKTFRDKDKFYIEAQKASYKAQKEEAIGIDKGTQPPADYMEAKRLDLVPLSSLDRIIVPADQYNELVQMLKQKDIKLDIIKQRKGESTNSAIKRSSKGKSNFIYGGASLGLLPLFDEIEETK